MAVGDVISGFSAFNTIMDFQPAAGVEVMITGFCTYNDAILFTNGTNTCAIASGYPNMYAYGTNANTKILVNNSRYIRLPANGYTGYWGLQIK